MNRVINNEKSVWQLQKAKAQFSEVVNCALNGGPQLVTRNGRPSVYIVSAETYLVENSAGGLNRKEILLQSPASDVQLDLSRDKSEGRAVVL